MSEPVRWGVLGAGKFALDKMAPAIHAARGADFFALGTSAIEKAAPFEAFRPGLRVYLDYAALLADPDIDAVYIPLPNHMHVEWTERALRAGKHVLCEKPIAMSASEIDPLIALRDETGLVAAEAYMIVHHPQWIRARELYQDGAIGKLVQVDCVFTYDNRADPENIRNRPETGGGSIPDIGVYTYGATRFVTGEEPETISAEIVWENGVDVLARVQARFPSYFYTAMTSMRAHHRQYVTFHGEDGVMTLTAPFNANVFGEAQLELDQPGFRKTVERWPGVNHYVLQVENFGRSVRTGAEYPCPLEFSRGTQGMIDRIFAAAKEA